MPPTNRPIFALPRQVVFTDAEACKYLRLDEGREDDLVVQVRALDRLVDRRGTLKCIMYRQRRQYHIDDLNEFLQNCRR